MLKAKTITIAAMSMVLGQDPAPLLRVPNWFALIDPISHNFEQRSSERLSLFYDSTSSFDSVVGKYEGNLRKADHPNLFVEEGGDRDGAAFVVNGEGVFCEILIMKQARPRVKLDCETETVADKSPSHLRFIAAHPKPKPPAPLPAGMHEIKYLIEGDCGAAGVTLQNGGGGTEQHEVSVPAAFMIRALSGAFLYVSAQKKGADGSVHVAILVDGVLIRQSRATAPYGIATASGKVAQDYANPSNHAVNP